MTRRPNKKGRIETEHYTKLIRQTMETPAWAALSTNAQALYPWLKLQWRGPDHNNNGAIKFSVRQAAQRLGVSVNTAAAAFRDLQAKGFIVVSVPGALGITGEARGPSYELTEIKLPTSESNDGRRLYRDWRKGHDLPVFKHNVNNPLGRNGNRKTPSQEARRSHLKSCDVAANPVSKGTTGRLSSCDVSSEKPDSNVIEMKTSLVTIPRTNNMPPDLRRYPGLDLCLLLRAAP